MSWVVTAGSADVGICHMEEFETKEEAEKHFEWCLHNYDWASSPQWEDL